MGTVIKSATSAFQYDDYVTLNAQGHWHFFIDRMQHLNIACVVIIPGHFEPGPRQARPRTLLGRRVQRS
jgi:hypothetical protein